MNFKPRTSQVLNEIAIRLGVVSSDHAKRATLQILKEELALLLVTITARAENPEDGVETAEAIIGQAAGPRNVMLIADKLAVQTFISQFAIDFDPGETLRKTARDLIQALRQVGKKEEVSARLTGVLDGIQYGIDVSDNDENQLFAAGDKAFASYKSLDEVLALDWNLAKEAYGLRRVLAKRLEFYQLQQQMVGARKFGVPVQFNRTGVSPLPESVAEPVAAEIVALPTGTSEAVETGWSPEIEFEDLTAELEAAINSRPFDRAG
jgi:hypothetical protein